MDRRSFLRRSAVHSGAVLAGASAASASGCGAALGPLTLGVHESNALLARLDRGLSRIRSVAPGEIARGVPRTLHPELAENVVKLTLEAFVVADVTRSVPDGAAVPRPLAERLAHEAPVLQHCASSHHALLTSLSAAHRARLNRHMRQRPDVPTEIAEWIDEKAGEVGAARESRLRLRRAAAELEIRMRRQSATAVIDDCTEKVGRVLEQSGSSLSLARSATTSAMLGAIWQQIDGVPPGGGGAGAGLGQPQPGPQGPERIPGTPPVRYPGDEPLHLQDSQWNARWGSPGDEEVMIGAVMMPFGLLTCGVLLFVGLGILIAGVVENENWDGTTEREVRERIETERRQQRMDQRRREAGAFERE